MSDDIVLILTSKGKGPLEHYLLKLSDGRTLPGQRSCSIKSSVDGATRFTIEFVVNNRSVKIADAPS